MLSTLLTTVMGGTATADTGWAAASVSTFAGSGSSGYVDGTGTGASFTSPVGMTSGGGYLYMSDRARLRRIDPTSAAVTTIASDDGSGCTVTATGALAVDSNYLYFLSSCFGNYWVRRVSLSSGAMSVMFTPGSAAVPTGMAVSPSGALYMVVNDKVQQINTSTFAITTVATVAPASGESFVTLSGLAADADGLWTVDTQLHRLLKVDASTGSVSEVSRSDAASPVTTMGSYVYTAVYGKDEVRQFAKSDGSALTIAGNQTAGYRNGSGAQAWFGGISGITTDGTRLFVADGPNLRVRALASTPAAATTQPAQWSNSVTLQGARFTDIAGGAATVTDGRGAAAGFGTIGTMHIVGDDAYVYGSGYLRKVNVLTGDVTTVAGTGTTGCQDSATGTSATVNISSMTDDGQFLYFLNACGLGDVYLRRMSLATHAVSTLFYKPQGPAADTSITTGPDGNIYVSTMGATLDRISTTEEAETAVLTVSAPGGGGLYGLYGLDHLTADGQYIYAVGRYDCQNYGGGCTAIYRINPSTWTYDVLANGSHAVGDVQLSSTLTSSGSYLYGQWTRSNADGTVDTGLGRWAKSDGTFWAVTSAHRTGGPTNVSYAGMDTHGHGLVLTDGLTQRVVRVVNEPSPLTGGGPLLPGESGSYSELNDCQVCHGDPVNTATGALVESTTDLALPGRGIPAAFGRTYVSTNASQGGPLGYGWTNSYGAHLAVDASSSGSLSTAGVLDVVEENGSILRFVRNGDGSYSAATRVLATLAHNGNGSWTFVRRAQTTLGFDSAGRLSSETDLNGYVTTLSYDASGRLATITDPAGRTLSLSYDGNNRISSVSDGAGRSVGYGYDANGNLTSVTDPTGATWQYGYDANHRLTALTDPRNHTTTTVYDSAGKVTSQTDRANRTTTFDYTVPTDTGSWIVTVTDPRGLVTRETYDHADLVSQTRAVGTASEATWTYRYDATTNGRSSVTDPLNHTWTYGYDAAGNQTSACDPLNHCTTRTFNALGEPLTVTDATNVTTTSTYDSAGNLQTVSTPLTGTSQTATTTYLYGDGTHPGDVTGITDPRGKTTHFTFDSYGQRTSVTDPTGKKTTYTYTCTPAGAGCRSNVGWVYSSVSPRGNATGASPAQFTTTFTRDDDGRTLTVTDPLGHATTYGYDGNGNRTSMQDANGHQTTYTFDNDDELTIVHRPDTTTVRTGYDADGNVTSQTDGASQVTGYGYDALNHVASMASPPTAANPNGIVTTYSYDAADRLSTVVNASNQTATYGYDAAGRLTSIDYSNPATPDVSYGYDADNRRTSMTDGAGTTSYSFDSLGRITDTTDGAGHHLHYDYDLAGNATAITYPNGKTISRGFDDAGRLTSVADWNNQTTSFGYNDDGAMTSASYPNGVVESTSRDRTDAISTMSDTSGASTLAAFDYTRDNDGLLTATTPTGSTGQTNESYGHSTLNQLTTYTTASTSGSYGYDAADNLTGLADGTTQTFDTANELQSATRNGTTTTFGYNARGDRTSSTTSGATTSYGYDQADRLTSYSNPSGTTATYSYNGDGLRFAKTVNGTTTDFAWDGVSDAVPQLLTAGQTNYLYGPGGLPIEQIDPTPTISRIDTASSIDTSGNQSVLTANFTATIKANDQILLAVNSVAGNDPSTPTGYTVVGTYAATAGVGETTTIYRKTAAGGETSAAVNFTGAVAHAKTLLAVVYRGVDPVHPIDVTPTTASAAPAGTSVDVPGVTTTVSGDELVAVESAANNLLTGSWTAPTGMTGRVSAGGSTIGSGIADQALTTAGATGHRVASFSQPAQLVGVLIALQRAPDTYFFHHDQQGSTRVVTDANGRTVATYTFDPYGNTAAHAGPDSVALLYDGQYKDGESGLYYLRARNYDPFTSQFLTRDPLGALTKQPYQYARADPMDWDDPAGLVATGTDGGGQLTEAARRQALACERLREAELAAIQARWQSEQQQIAEDAEFHFSQTAIGSKLSSAATYLKACAKGAVTGAGGGAVAGAAVGAIAGGQVVEGAVGGAIAGAVRGCGGALVVQLGEDVAGDDGAKIVIFVQVVGGFNSWLNDAQKAAELGRIP